MSKSTSSLSENGSANKPGGEDFLVVGIGASAGGIRALREFFGNVPEDAGAAYVVILHLSPDHDSQLASVLQAVARIPVTQATERVRVEPDHVYVVPPNQSLKMLDGHITVGPINTVEERRAPVDIFFRTLAESHGGRAVCVVLSGTGANGSMGLKRVKERGGAAFVQNPREAEYSEMPRNAIATDLVDAILNASEIPAKIVAYKAGLGMVEIPEEPGRRGDDQQQALREIFTQLRVHTGHDFSNYKRATVLRRIERRVSVRELADLPSYAAHLRENPEEAPALLRDLLISVTNFFRDKEAFARLETDVLPRLLHGKTRGDQLRVWVAGCATGEEAYSIAMLLAERTLGVADAPQVQIFASDIDEQAVAAAREGLYTLNDAADVSPERLRRFFTADRDGYRVRRELRETILFAQHNLIKDPPFSHLDLVTCRNLLIYLNGTAQERLMETLHFALNPGGYLFLGSAESIDGAGDLYAPFSREHNIFQSREAVKRVAYPAPETAPAFRLDGREKTSTIPPPEQETRTLERITYGDLHGRLLEQYAPPSVVVNEEYEVVHLSERAGRYMQIAGGEPSSSLLKLVLPELRIELRTALYQAVQRQTNVEVRNLKVFSDGREEAVDIQVRPVLRAGDTARGFILVLFEPAADAGEGRAEPAYSSPEPVARQLEEEVVKVRAQLRAATEQHELQAEELKASNEELQAINEELRSAAEELETSKEELQSLNEELTTVNQELKVKVEEVSQSSNNFRNLINSTDVGTIFLDRSFRVDLFTPAAREIFNLIPNDIGRPLSDITNRLAHDGITADAEAVLEKLQTIEREVAATDGRAFLMRLSPYRTAEDRINGVVVTFVDITERKRAEEARAFLAAIVESADDAMLTVNFDGRITSWNSAAENLYGYPAAEAVGQPLTMLTLPEDLREVLANAERIKRGEAVETYETIRVHKGGENLELEIALSPVRDEAGRIIGISTIARDITARKQAEEALRESEGRLRALLENLPGGAVFILDREMRYLTAEGEALRAAGFTPQDLVGRTIREALPPELAAEYEPKFRQALAGEPYHYEHDAHGRSFISRGVPLAGAGGDANALLAISYDITERKRAEELLRQSEENYRAIVNQSIAGIFKLDLEGNIVFVNDRVGEMLGYTSEEMLRLTVADIVYERDAERNEQLFERLKAEGRAFEIEKRLVRKDGSLVWVSDQVSPIYDEVGRPRQVTVVSVDITVRKVVETLLDTQKRALEMVVGGSPLPFVLAYLARIIEQQSDGSSVVSIMLLDAEGRLRDGASPSLPDEILRVVDGIPADENVGTCSRTAATGTVTVTPEIARDPRWKKLKHLPLKYGLLAAWSMPILDSAGRVLGTMGTYFRERREPTPFERQTVEILTRTAALAIERKRSEEELRESQKFVQGIVSSAPMALYIFDLTERKNVYLSPQVSEMFGHTAEEMQAHGSNVLAEFFHPEDLPHVAKHFDRIRQSGENEIFEIEYRMKHANGAWVWIKSRDVIYRRDEEGVPTQILGTAEDVTHRKRAEMALRESETRFRATFEQANVGIVQLSADGKFLLVNPGFCKIVGYSEDECRNMTVRDLTHPDDYELEEAETRRLMAGEIAGYTLDKRFIHQNGSIVWGTMTAALVRTESGAPFHLLAIVEDVTERKRAEETLRASEERFRLLVESAKDYAILTLDPERRVTSWNPGAEAIFGYAEAEIIGQSGDVLFTPEDRENKAPEKEVRAAAARGRASDERWHLRKDGSRFFASGVMRPLAGGEPRGFVKIARDLTARREAEEALRRSHDELEERVRERTGELQEVNELLLGEVSERRAAEDRARALVRQIVTAQEDERKRVSRDLHDHLGQQLTALQLKLEAHRARVAENASLRAHIEEIQTVARQLDGEVDFLAWELRPASLDDLGLPAALDNFVEEWSKHFGVPAEFHTSGFVTEADRLPPELETNLYRIAQEALNNVYKHAASSRVDVIIERRADYVALIIEDDGKGFDLNNAAGPKDRGIGLSSMRERASFVGGTLEIESAPGGGGTTVFVRVSLAVVSGQ